MIDLAVCDIEIQDFGEMREDIIFAEMARRMRPQKEAIAMITPLLSKWMNTPVIDKRWLSILLYELWKSIEQDRNPHTMEDALEWLDELEQKPN
jgi:hypothetical protein